MNCKEYMDLTQPERLQLQGLVWHLIQNDSKFFQLADMAVRRASEKGLLDGVVIMPQVIHEKKESSLNTCSGDVNQT